VYAGSVSAAGESDPIASDPGSCDDALRVVRRVVRVIDIDSVAGRDGSGPESGPTGHCQNFAFARDYATVCGMCGIYMTRWGEKCETLRSMTRFFLGKSDNTVYNTDTQKHQVLVVFYFLFFILTYYVL
jgi:hypothetical protein